jgi:branched-chain amino acid aminotransferase
MVALRPLSKIWFDGKLVDWDAAQIHVLTHGLHYGYAIFEGIRSFDTPRGGAVFRLREHMERFLDSAKIYAMPIPYTVDELVRACVDLVRANGIGETYIRPIAFSGYGTMGIDPRGAPLHVAMANWVWGPYLGVDGATKGVRAMVSSWARVDARSLPPQAKCSSNYANGILAKMEAQAGGYDEAILLNTGGMVAEGPGENIFRVKGNVVSTPPASSGILRGITRDTLLKFVQEEGLTFHRTDFTREELFTADELIYTGTAAGVTPIREVDGRPIGDGKFTVTRRLQARYEAATHGHRPEYEAWLTRV